MAIVFLDAPGKHFPKKNRLKACLSQTAARFGKSIADLNYQFVDDGHMLELNRQYLNHDEFTDILTFDQSEDPDTVEGDVYISRDRVDENGRNLGSGVLDEYCRVVVHGLLHLCGLDDHSVGGAAEMRREEDAFIRLYHQHDANL